MTPPRLPKLIYLTGLILCVVACRPTNVVSRVKSFSTDFFVAIFDQDSGVTSNIQLSAPKELQGDLCVTGPGASCDTSAEKFPLKEVTKVGDRLIYSPQSAPQLASLKDYLLIDRAGMELFRFRLAPRNGGGGHLDSALAMIAIDNLKSDLTYLTQDKFYGRLAGTTENDKIAEFLIDELKKSSIRPLFGDRYLQPFKLPNGPTAGKTTNNIIALIEGNDPVLKDEYVIIGAHMDHTGTLDRGYTCSTGGQSDRICNGADDNGSGAIALLNVAKSLSASRNLLKRSVMIMWFSGEEEGLVGSKYYVANPAVPLGKHVFMINMDMVGYAKSFGNAIAAIGTVTSKWGADTARTISKKYPQYKLKFTENVEGGSDHAPFMNKGIPGVFYHTGVSNNPNYHRTSDHVELIDFDGMMVATKIAYETVVAASTTSELKPLSGMSLLEPVKFVSDAEASKGCHYLMDYKYVE